MTGLGRAGGMSTRSVDGAVGGQATGSSAGVDNEFLSEQRGRTHAPRQGRT